MTTRNDTDILSAMRKNQESGFQLLMAKYKEAIYWHIRRLVVSHADAQDATQETFVRIFRSFNQLKDDASLTAWVYRIATNEALRLLKRWKNERDSLENSDNSLYKMAADSYVDYSDLETIRLQQAILTLPTKQQLAFNLRYYNELGYDEIATITDSTPESIKSNYHIAKGKVIKYMNLNN
ncbi:MAG: RNA polymerase sigma factor [Mangrovibacterium sp.]